MLELNLYRNKMTTSKGYGMIYGRVEKKETYDLAKLAEHMHNHNSPYSAGVILGILKDMVSCIRELCLEGNQVKIEDLAIFSVQIASKGANSFLAYDIAKHPPASSAVPNSSRTVSSATPHWPRASATPNVQHRSRRRHRNQMTMMTTISLPRPSEGGEPARAPKEGRRSRQILKI